MSLANLCSQAYLQSLVLIFNKIFATKHALSRECSSIKGLWQHEKPSEKLIHYIL